MASSQRTTHAGAAGLPAAGRRRATSSSSARSTPRTRSSRSAWRSSAAAPPASPPPTGCCSCSGDDPELMEQLGEVPVAVIEKAKTCGGHNLSGAVMRPGPLQELFPDLTREDWRKQGFAYGEVDKEAVYMTPTAKRALRIPTPPPFKNHGNEVVSVSALARYQQQQAEEGGAYILTETVRHPAARRGRPRPRRPHGRQGPRQGRRAAGQLRAGHRRRRQGHGAGRGLLGPPHRRRDQGVRPRPRTASRRSGSSASRRSGRSPSRWTASSTRSARGR